MTADAFEITRPDVEVEGQKYVTLMEHPRGWRPIMYVDIHDEHGTLMYVDLYDSLPTCPTREKAEAEARIWAEATRLPFVG